MHLAGGNWLRAGVEENTAALGSVKVGELSAVRSLKARRLQNCEVAIILFYAEFHADHSNIT